MNSWAAGFVDPPRGGVSSSGPHAAAGQGAGRQRDDDGRPLRVLLAAEGDVAASLIAALRAFRGLVCDVDHVIDPVTVVAEIALGQHDAYILGPALGTTPALDMVPEGLEALAIRPIIVVSDEALHGAPLEHPNFVEIPQRELTTALLERTLRFGLERAELRQRIAELELRYELTVQAANDGLFSWDFRNDLCRFSPRWKALIGYGEGELGRTAEEWLSRVHPDDIESLRANLKAHLDGLTPVHEFEHRVRHKNGRWRWVLSRGLVHRDEWGRPTLLAGSLTDISRRKAFEHRLQHDAVTGLASRMTLMERLSATLERSKRDGVTQFALLFLNVDRFKVVNDSIGLESGDRVLSQLGERMLGCVGSTHLVCRYGGDEFAILLEGNVDPAEAERIANAIHDSLSRPFDIDGHEVFATVSIGITHGDSGYDRAADVIRDVGVAMNAAKRQGKARTVTFDASMRVEALSTMRIHTALRKAVDADEFEVFYQPIVSLARARLTGFEALVRWRHPRRGIVPPNEFIPVAEETGLIVPMGRIVLERACKQLAEWRNVMEGGADLTVSVNLSGKQLASATLVDDVKAALSESGLPGSGLKLELTESSLVVEPQRARLLLEQLRAIGVQIYIDDFGTGYSTFAYLQQFAVDGLKIEKTFVDMICVPERKSVIVPSIVSLAHSLGMGVVAEGIETAEQLAVLREMQCTEGQGYLFSRPVPAAEAGVLIERGVL